MQLPALPDAPLRDLAVGLGVVAAARRDRASRREWQCKTSRVEKVRRTKKGIDYVAKVLKVKRTVTTRAVFWRIPHATRADEIKLKLGRYRPTEAGEEVDVGAPKSELTLADDEFRALADFLANHYEPLREGARRYLVLDSGLSSVQVEQVRALFGNPDRESLVGFLINEKHRP